MIKKVRAGVKRPPLKKKWVYMCSAIIAVVASSLFLRDKLMTVDIRARSEAPFQKGHLKVEKFAWYEQDKKYAMLQPEAGQYYISIDVTMKHTYAVATWFAPSLDSYIKDGSGKLHQIEMVALDQPLAGGSYANNQPVAGSLSYMVPDKSELTWCYKLSQDKQEDELCIPLDQYNQKGRL